MNNVWEPVGPLPAAVYWRRRFVALASAVVLVGVVLATAGTAGNAPGTPVPAANRSVVPAPVGAGTTTPRAGGGAAATEGAADAVDTGAPASGGASGPATPGTAVTGPAATGSARPGAAPSGIAATPPGTALPGTPAPTAPPDGPAAAPVTGAAGPAPSTATTDEFSVASTSGGERIRPDDRSTAAVQPTVPVPSTGPVPCTNAMLSIVAQLEHAVHRVGSHPVLRLVITDVSGQPCVRDLDSARQEIVVWSADGVDRLWSSNDCVNAPTSDLRTLVPGRPVAFAVTWGERTTTPGCREPRTRVPAGTYRLMVRLDNLISEPTPFIRTP